MPQITGAMRALHLLPQQIMRQTTSQNALSFSRRKQFLSNMPRTKIQNLICSMTERTQRHLTPETELHLVTPACSLWHSPGEESPFPDPFWAFYWPGGQALTRYILDHPSRVRGHSVLDVGSGCGASAIAAVMSGAQQVTANDICPVAAEAIAMNAKLNSVTLSVDTADFVGQPCNEWDTLFLGDMFYDQEFTDRVFDWLLCLQQKGKQILIGDPGRIYFLRHPITKRLTKLASYELPTDSKQENNGMTEGHVWLFK